MCSEQQTYLPFIKSIYLIELQNIRQPHAVSNIYTSILNEQYKLILYRRFKYVMSKSYVGVSTHIRRFIWYNPFLLSQIQHFF